MLKKHQVLSLVGSCLLVTLPLTAQAKEDAGAIVTGAGSSLAAPVYQSWAMDFKKVDGASVNYQALGSSAGVDQVEKRLIDFSGTDKPLNIKELKQHALYQFPTLVSAIAVIVNLPGVDAGALKLDPEILAHIYAGDITRWDDKAIRALNPKLKLPEIPIGPVHRGDGSGTTWVFSSYLSQVSPDWRKRFGAGALIAWPGGAGARGNDGIASLVRQTPGSIGYVEYAYALHSAVNFAKLKNASGNYVLPDLKSTQAAAREANWAAGSGQVSLLNAPGINSWPITAASFALAPVPTHKNKNEKALKDFFAWSFQNGQQAETNLGYVPLPKEVAQNVIRNWPNI